MKRTALIITLAALALTLCGGALAETKKAQGSIVLTDPAGDVTPITTSNKSYPGFDVVKLSLTSDGKKLNIGAELKDPPCDFASSVLVLYFDVDNNPDTGVQLGSFGKPKGFEYKGAMQACIKYDNGMVACSGGSSKGKVKERFAGMNLRRFTGTSAYKTEYVLDSMGFPGRKASVKTPIKGKLVQGSVEYADLGVKPGQTVRILVSEASSPRSQSLFPEIILTLK